MKKFQTKGEGRIYLLDMGDQEVVKGIMKDQDEYEYDYLPSDLFAPMTDYPQTVYVGKFDDLDLDDLTAKCGSEGIGIFCYAPVRPRGVSGY